MNDFYSLLDAKQALENEMTARQKRLIDIVTEQGRDESLSAKKATKDKLENEIEDLRNALEKLEAPGNCASCGAKVDVHQGFRIRVAKSEHSPNTNLMIARDLVRVECADCVRRAYDSQRQAERIATRDEIEEAFEMLTLAERRKLQNFADWRVRGLGRASRGSTGEDLVQEALLSTLVGAEDAGKGKHWSKSRVDFSGHLKKAIQRISWGWKEKFSEREPWLESEVMTSNAEGDELSPLDSVASDSPAADQNLSVHEEIERRFRIFANDNEASAVLQGRLGGMTTAREIMQEFRLTKRQYQAAGNRIRSPRSVLVIEDYDQVLTLFVKWLKQMGYAVHTACNGVEGLRLYRECGPFDVVMISHSLNQNGIELGMNIFKSNRSQRMVITTTYGDEEDVLRSSELMHVPILLKPFRRLELRTVLEKIHNQPAKLGPATQQCSMQDRSTSALAAALPVSAVAESTVSGLAAEATKQAVADGEAVRRSERVRRHRPRHRRTSTGSKRRSRNGIPNSPQRGDRKKAAADILAAQASDAAAV